MELRALVEAAAESADEAEQAGALLLAGIALFDMGDLHAAVPLLASAAAAAENVGDLRGARRRARARRRRACSGCGARAKPRRRGGTSPRRRGGRAPGKKRAEEKRQTFSLGEGGADARADGADEPPRRRVSRRRSASAPERRRRRSGPRRPRRASLKIHKKTERRKAFAPWRPSATRALGGAARARQPLHRAPAHGARARRPRRTSRTPVRSRGRSARRRRRRPGCAQGTRGTGGRRLRRRPRRRARGDRKAAAVARARARVRRAPGTARGRRAGAAEMIDGG